MKVFIFLLFFLFNGIATASSLMEECYFKADFYYNVALSRDSGVSKVDVEQFITKYVLENNVPTSHLDNYIAAIQYVYAVNTSPKQIASGIFSECISPSTRT